MDELPISLDTRVVVEERVEGKGGGRGGGLTVGERAPQMPSVALATAHSANYTTTQQAGDIVSKVLTTGY